MIIRNKKGQFIKGIHPKTEFKKGHKISEELKIKNKERMIGNKYAFGYKHTDLELKLISQSVRGKKIRVGKME